MTPDAIIEAYVNDVAQRLPRAKRNDVAFELQALLREELQGKADEAGRPADEAMTLELVRAFGAPETVADRYRPPGIVIIPPQASRMFIWLALGGVALQWLVTLPAALSQPTEPGREHIPFVAWYFAYGLGALWWPGFMIVATIIAAWVRTAWPPSSASNWRPRAADTDRINQTGRAFGAVAAVIGVAIVVGAIWSIDNALPPHLQRVFALNPAFLPIAGPVVVAMWLLTAVVFGVTFFEGRWRPLTRRLDTAMTVVWLGVMLWLLNGPPVFQGQAANEGTRGGFAIVVLILLIDLAARLWKARRRVRPPADVTALAKN